MSQKPELISFEICPFVQRSVITMLEKGQDFDIKYIDLANKPEWFLKVSPFGKVPVLKVKDTVIFESAVINEYLDETNPPSMHPQDPIKKAHNRAWIEFASQLNMDLFVWSLSQDQIDHDEKYEKMMMNLKKVEEQLGEGPFFNGVAFNLVDAAFAPYFMRLAFLSESTGTNFLKELPKCLKWHLSMKDKESVMNSVIPTIKERFLDYIRDKKSYLSNQFVI